MVVLLSGRTFPLWLPSTQLEIKIEDIAAAFKCAISTDIQNGLQIYNVSSGAALSAKDIVTVIERLLDLESSRKIHVYLLYTPPISTQFSHMECRNTFWIHFFFSYNTHSKTPIRSTSLKMIVHLLCVFYRDAIT